MVLIVHFCVVGGRKGKFEVWDVKKRVLIKSLQLEKTYEGVSCLTTSNNILAVATDDSKFSLWDVNTLTMFWCQTYEMEPTSVYLTDDSK